MGLHQIEKVLNNEGDSCQWEETANRMGGKSMSDIYLTWDYVQKIQITKK